MPRSGFLPLFCRLWLGAALCAPLVVGCGGGGRGAPNDGFASSGSAQLSVSATSVSFRAIYAQPAPAAQTLSVTFEGDGLVIGYPPGVDPPSWLDVSLADAGAEASPVDVVLSVTSATRDAGEYTTSVRLATGRLDPITGNVDESSVAFVDVGVSLSVVNEISVTPERLEPLGTRGEADVVAGTVEVQGADLTWTATTSEPWLNVSPTQGSTPASLEVRVTARDLPPGQHSARIDVQATEGGSSASVEVLYSVDLRRLLAAHTGVALVAFPTAPSHLQREVAVYDSIGAGASWQASSDQSWLSVSTSGSAGAPLQLGADPTGLASDQVHYANVSLTSSDPEIENTETIVVGLYVASADPEPQREIELDADFDIYDSAFDLVVDPVRPYVYLARTDDAIVRYPLYGGEPVVSPGLGEALVELAVSDDGSALYAVDRDAAALLRFPLPELDAPDGVWPFPAAGDFESAAAGLTFMRTFGKDLLLVSNGAAHDAGSGELLRSVLDVGEWPGAALFAPSRNGSVVFASTATSGSGYGTVFSRYLLRYSSAAQSLRFDSTHQFQGGFDNVRDLVSSPDGERLYVDDLGVHLYALEQDALALQIELDASRTTGGGIELGPDGSVYAGCSSDTVSKVAVRAYDAAGNETGRYALPGGFFLERQMKLSADGSMLVSVSENASRGTSLTLHSVAQAP